MKPTASTLRAIVILLCCGTVIRVFADTTNLPAIADTAMRSSAPDNNFGLTTQLPVGVANFGAPANRALFKFDVSVLPTNAVIDSVTLRLVVAVDPGDPAFFDFCRMLKDWNEGTGTTEHSGSAALTGETTWNSQFQDSTFWGAGGGLAGTDFAGSPSASTVSISGNTNDITDAGLATDVQLWVQDPGTNFGWIMLATGGAAATGKLLGSRQDPDRTPTLIIDFTLPSAPPPANPPTISGVILSGNLIHFSFNAQSNRTYAVEFRDSLLTGNWDVLTNIPAQPSDVVMQVTTTNSNPSRFFRVRTP